MINLVNLLMQSINKNTIFLFIFFVFLVIFGFLSAYNSLDPDFGWHLKTGQLILERGIPETDWYTHTMPSFPWIDHEWFLDILIFKLYSISRIHFLTFVFTFLYTTAFFISIRKQYSFSIVFFPILLGYLSTMGFLGIRPQLLTVLFLAILIKWLDGFTKSTSNLIYYSPLLFFAWVNLHGGFFVGIVILLMVLLLEILKKLKIWQKVKALNFINNLNLQEQPLLKIKKLSVVFLTSFLATLINPYGWNIYLEIISVVKDNYLRSHILEWMPIFTQGANVMISYIYIILFVVFLFMFYKKINLNNIVISLFFLILSLLGTRYLLIFVIWTIPVFSDAIFYMSEKYNLKAIFGSLQTAKKRAFIVFMSAILIIPAVFGVYSSYKGFFDTKSYYPEKAIPFIEALPRSKNIFNYYGWGGYLIWKVPEIKVFIDGRMPSWRQNDKFVFGDYVKITEAKEGFQDLIDKYKIKTFILPRDERSELEKINDNSKKTAVDNSFSNFMCFIKSCSKKNIYDELERIGWRSVYQDENTVILEQ